MTKTAAPPKPKKEKLTVPAPVLSRRGLFELINDDARIIEEEIDKLVAEGMAYADAVGMAVSKVDDMTTDKALAYAGLIQQLEEEAEVISTIAKRQAARASARVNRADALRQRMLQLLPKEFEAENAFLKVKFSPTGYRLVDSTVADAEKLPEALRRFEPKKFMVNKDAAKDHLLAIIAEIKLLPEDQRKAAYEERTKDLQGIHLVEGWRVSIR